MNSTPISYARLLLLGLGFMGISLLWGIYDAAVPIILQDGRPDFRDYAGVDGYGLSAPLMGSIMTLDNLAALLILPYVGAWSDRLRSPWGRRKPFIAVGAPLAAMGFVAIPFVMDRPLVFFMLAIMATLIAMDLFRTPVIALASSQRHNNVPYSSWYQKARVNNRKGWAINTCRNDTNQHRNEHQIGTHCNICQQIGDKESPRLPDDRTKEA